MKNKLRSLMAANGDNYASLGQKMGLSASSVCKKVNGKVKFSWEEMKALKKLYELTAEEAGLLFFSE